MIVVVNMLVVGMIMVIMVVVVVHPKDNNADAVDDQTEKGHEDGLIEDNFHGGKQPVDTFPCHQHRKQG